MSESGARHAVEAPGREGWARFLPCLEWLRSYDKGDAFRDALAGFFLAVLLVPQALAYALLADLPAQVGLFAALMPPVIYALFGTSRYLSLGPVALVSLLAGDAIGRTAEATGIAPASIALVLAALVGAILVVLGIARFGIVADFVSRPVLDGFTAAAAVLIITSQIRHILGVEVARGGTFVGSARSLFGAVADVHAPTLVLGLGALVLLPSLRTGTDRLLERFGVGRDKRLPVVQGTSLIILMAAMVAVWRLELGARDVAVIGALPAGVPALGLPPISLDTARQLTASALTIAAVAFVTALAIAKSLAGRQRQKVDADQEMIALGLANLGASLSGGYPVGGSVSRSALTEETGGRTPAAPAFAAVFVAAAALFAGPYFAFLPKAALAAMIIVAVVGLIDVRGALRAFRFSRADGGVLLLTFAAVLLLGLERGILAGALSALAVFIWQSGRPRIVVEGPADGGEHFRGQERGEVEAIDAPFLVLRVDRSLFFGNVRYVQQQILQAIAERPRVQFLVLDLSAIGEIDASALGLLESMADDLSAAGITFVLAAAKAPLRERLKFVGYIDQIGKNRLFDTVHAAVESLREAQESAPAALE